MSVRKRAWTTAKGEAREAWTLTYRDRKGDRCHETFPTRREALSRQAVVVTGKIDGTFIAPSKSVTVSEAAASWIRASEARGLERATLKNYREHVNLHIVPFIGHIKLADVTVPLVRQFEDELREHKRSRDLIKRVVVSLGSILADAQESGLAAHNAVHGLSRNRRGRKDRQAEKRRKGKLKVGVDIPTPEEISAILSHADSRWRPFLVTAVFTGLRASELRGLRWCDVDLKAGELHVTQRADRFNDIGKPKSASGERVVPFGKLVANTLREWKLRSGPGDLVFSTRTGGIIEHSNLVKACLPPAQIAAGVVVDGKAKYTGLHALRHFYASWCINPVADGGRGLPAKVVQERLGHSSITMTLDVYGHLFPRGDDLAELTEAEESIMALGGRA